MINRRKFLEMVGLGVILGISGACPSQKPKPPLPPEDKLPIAERINSLLWTSYAPTNFNPEQNIFPSEASIREDMEVLRKYNFDGIITYASDGTLNLVPRVAKEEGFQSVIMGVWNPTSNLELSNAVDEAYYVSAYVIGNEGLYGRYSLNDLKNAGVYLSNETGKPVSTTEERGDYVIQEVLDFGDFLMPNIHPYWDGIVDSINGAAHVLNHYNDIKTRGGKAVLVKETGYPTAGDVRVSEELQRDFCDNLSQTEAKFSYFESFDQAWKRGSPVEPHWGILKSNRTPKAVLI